MELVFAVRKGAHLTEYALLGLFIWRALRQPVPGDTRKWSWRQMRLAWGLAVIYAASDEFHQYFVPSREARVTDVGIDACGALIGLVLLWLIGRWRKSW